MEARPTHIDLADGSRVSCALILPPGARCVLTFAHGAGAAMSHPFMEETAQALARAGVATLRFNFPFMEAMGEKRWARPDPPALAQVAVRAAADCARVLAPGLPLFAGGKSFGARMTSLAAAERPIEGVRGLVFIGFPLHPAKKPATARAQHLPRVNAPMLFVQGSRDALADLSLVRETCAALPRATLHVIDGADHAFHVPVRSGRTDADVIEEIATAAAAWIDGV